MARTSKSRGVTPFQMRSGNASPYKFLGGVGKFLKKAVNTTPVGMAINAATGNKDAATFGNVGAKIMGGGGAAGAVQGVATNPVAAAAQQKAMVGGGMVTPSAMIQRNEFEKRNSPITQRRSPLKATDRVLVEGAYDAASGHGTVKYGATAGARAWTDMVNTVEDTVNRSSKAMAAKDRRRQKVYDRSRKKYRRWYEAPQRNIPGVNDISNQRHHDITHPHGLNN